MNTQSTTKKGLNIGILGGEGFLGSDLVKFLSINHEVDSITRENNEDKKGAHYEVFINANGNSKRFWANKNPTGDFFASTASVYQSIFDFPSDFYIYISSPDVYEDHTGSRSTREEIEIDPTNLSSYGFNKYLGELIVKKHKKKYLILRSSMILGKNLKKGPFYDIINDNPIFVTHQTQLQLITTHAIAEIIKSLLDKHVLNNILNVGGMGTFAFAKINEYFNFNIHVSLDAERQIYEMNVEKVQHLYPSLKTSEEYLQDFLKDYLYR